MAEVTRMKLQLLKQLDPALEPKCYRKIKLCSITKILHHWAIRNQGKTSQKPQTNVRIKENKSWSRHAAFPGAAQGPSEGAPSARRAGRGRAFLTSKS
jgi:hypothetical protein